MKRFFNIILGITLFSVYLIANEKIINQSEFENKTIFIDVNSYKILQFDKRIKDVQITNSENVVAEFLEYRKNPLTRLKIYAKEISNESAIITFQDNTLITIGFNIIPHLKNIISMVETIYPGVKVQQINDTIFLKGNVQNQKDKTKILEMFTKFDVDPEKKVVDMLSTSNPKMMRIKLYAVEIDNSKGLDLQNNWTTSVRNYEVSTSGTTYTYDYTDGYLSQYNGDITDAVDSIVSSAVSLTGGLTGAANFLSENFNTALTVSYLADEGVANVLDESTLITLENEEALFKAGGEFYVKLEADENSELITKYYGLKLKLTAKEVMNDEFVHLKISTETSDLDWTNAVDDIPSITSKSIDTTIIVKDGATVILGGLVSNNNATSASKVPLLGDIPILGALFKSSSFTEGKSELVFFITPEIVKAVDNNQIKQFNSNKRTMLKRKNKSTPQKYLEAFNLDFSKSDDLSRDTLDTIEHPETPKPMSTEPMTEMKKKKPIQQKNIFKESVEQKLTDEEMHKQRVNEILGY